ncbi:MAG: glycosyltransferase family 4 protein [Hyphomicrobiaceae bacterium]
MTVLIATDAWHPQINGVVRTLEALRRSLNERGTAVEFLTPEGFPSLKVPTYPGLRCAIPNGHEIARRIARASPDAIHIATEGPIGLAVRRYCLRRGLPFTTSLTTRFAEYVAARFPVPVSWGYAALRRFHSAAAATMVSTPSLRAELEARGFTNLCMWSRGVDTALFRPDRAMHLDLPRPIFMNVGRIAVEKNLGAFLSLDLPGTKVVIGHGPQEAALRARHPDAVFLGAMSGETLAAHLAAADVFVFPSRTDTFGIAQLEALASGVPLAAFPVTGPLDVVGRAPVGVLSEDLRQACLDALTLSRAACRTHALGFSWARSAGQFIANLRPIHAEVEPAVAAMVAGVSAGALGRDAGVSSA